MFTEKRELKFCQCFTGCGSQPQNTYLHVELYFFLHIGTHPSRIGR